MRSSLWADETARARHRAVESLCATVCPNITTFTAYASAGEIRLCYIPSLVSSVLITSRHNTSCSSTFPGPRWQRGAARGRPALIWKLQTCSCHCVSPSLWFYCVTYGLCWVCSCGGSSLGLMNCPVFWMPALISSCYGYITRGCYVTAALQFVLRSQGPPQAAFELYYIKKSNLSHK